MNFTDTHSHINAEEFKEDIDQVINRANDSGVTRIVIPAVSPEDFEAMEQIQNSYEGIHLAYGLHPTEIDNSTNIAEQIELIRERVESKRAVAIGETGLDMYWSTEFISKQIESLHAHIELSIEHNLPLILHTRDAFDQMFEVLNPYKGRVRGVFHGYSGSASQAERIIELGDFYFGIGGVVTFKKSTLPDVVANIPLSRIILETDAPYLTPTPHRGKRNEPSYIPIIAKKISEIRGVEIEEISKMSEIACRKIFNI